LGIPFTNFNQFKDVCCKRRFPKGKTMRTEAKLGPDSGSVMKHTENGWATANLIVEYLQRLHTEIADKCLCVPIPDVYPAHRTNVAVATAEECDIELLFAQLAERANVSLSIIGSSQN
jgi:hypothetical protein